MRVLVASDKFKGSMTAEQACEAIARGLPAGEVEIVQMPIADGGEGMAEALHGVLGGEWIEVDAARDPLGRRVSARYLWIAERGMAVIEMSEASGLWRMAEAELDPWRATTHGTGDLIRDALGRGARDLIIGLGGSATNDGGLGMAEALGLAGREGNPVSLDGVIVTAACDVRNPLLGENGCTRIFGPQKGVAAADFERHEARLQALVGCVDRGEELAIVPGSGAAGGLGFGCLAWLGAELRPGFQLVAEAMGLEKEVAAADLVITGEGSLDFQSMEGKAPAGVAQLGRDRHKAVVAFAGVADPAIEVGNGNLFDRIWQIRPPEMSVEESMTRGPELLEAAVRAAWFELRVLR